MTTFLVGVGITAHAQEDFQVLQVFPGGQSGYGPTTNLIKAQDGNLYGMTPYELYRIAPGGEYIVVARPGGAAYPSRAYGILASDGAIHFGGGLRVTLTGEVTRTHVFTEPAEFSPVIQASDGYLYGTTGRDGAFRRGTVYRMTVEGGQFSVLHHFTADEQPENSYSGPITEGADGNFYINAPYAPSGACCGAIYRMTPDGAMSTFHLFDASEGWTTHSPLFLANDGQLYGSTAGPTAVGAIYRLRIDGDLTIVHAFTNVQSGAWMLNQFSDGHLYFVFDNYIWRMTLSGEITPLHRAKTPPEYVRYGQAFFDVVEGVDGDYYGVAAGGGGSFGQQTGGSVFRLNATRSPCANVVELLSDEDQNFYLTQFIKTETPAVWGVWMVTASSFNLLWLTAMPAITPTVGFERSYYPFPRVGTVGVLSVLITSHFNVCTDWKTVETGID